MIDLTDLAAAIANVKDGETIAAKPGVLLLTQALPQLNASNVTLALDRVTLRMQLHPSVSGTDIGHIAAMNTLGLAGRFPQLSPAQQSQVNTIAKNVDVTGVRAAVDAYKATLPVVTERLWDVKPPTLGEITYNGLKYQFVVHWGSGLSKGVLTVKLGVFGTSVVGATFDNARMEGSSYNASGIRSQGGSLRAERCRFNDCEDGILGSTPQGILNPNGDWYAAAPTRLDLYGYNVDVDCTYDNCGSGGKAHGAYKGSSLANMSIRPHVVRANAGHGLHMAMGPQLVLEGVFEDPNDSGGYVQCIDLTCGPGYVINNTITKASMGTGNYNAPLMMRNNREPIPDWMETALIAKGNDITYDLPKASCFVNVLEDVVFQNGWPGRPRPIRGVITNNVFRCRPGAPVAKTAIKAGSGALLIGNNPIVNITDVVPSPAISLPNYEWSRDSFRTDFLDLIWHVDPGATWAAELFSLPIVPNGVIVPPPDDSAADAPPAPEPDPAPPPAEPSPSDPLTPQETIAAMQKEIDDLKAASDAVAAAAAASDARATAAEADLAAMTQERDALQARIAKAEADLEGKG